MGFFTLTIFICFFIIIIYSLSVSAVVVGPVSLLLFPGDLPSVKLHIGHSNEIGSIVDIDLPVIQASLILPEENWTITHETIGQTPAVLASDFYLGDTYVREELAELGDLTEYEIYFAKPKIGGIRCMFHTSVNRGTVDEGEEEEEDAIMMEGPDIWHPIPRNLYRISCQQYMLDGVQPVKY